MKLLGSRAAPQTESETNMLAVSSPEDPPICRKSDMSFSSHWFFKIKKKKSGKFENFKQNSIFFLLRKRLRYGQFHPEASGA
jgi:hypothetical protein